MNYRCLWRLATWVMLSSCVTASDPAPERRVAEISSMLRPSSFTRVLLDSGKCKIARTSTPQFAHDAEILEFVCDNQQVSRPRVGLVERATAFDLSRLPDRQEFLRAAALDLGSRAQRLASARFLISQDDWLVLDEGKQVGAAVSSAELESIRQVLDREEPGEVEIDPGSWVVTLIAVDAGNGTVCRVEVTMTAKGEFAQRATVLIRAPSLKTVH